MTELTIIAHNIRSTHNVGAIFRTAEGLGVHEIILSGYTPYPIIPGDTRLPHISAKITKDIHKTALDAETLVPFRYIEAIELVVAEMRERNIPLFALEQTSDSVLLGDFDTPERMALLLGEEVEGVEAGLLERCQGAVEIPMVGKKESFNVSVAAGIAMWHILQPK